MKTMILVPILTCLMISAGWLANAAEDPAGKNVFSLTSPVFSNGGQIPEKYTCKGADTNPPLSIRNIPDGTHALLLTVREPDNPITPWTNWLVYNIDPNLHDIKEGSVPGIQALNDFGNFYYGGPCTFDAKKHHYVFAVYALSESLDDINEGATMDIVEKAMKSKVIAKAILIGIYQNPLWGKEDAPL